MLKALTSLLVLLCLQSVYAASVSLSHERVLDHLEAVQSSAAPVSEFYAFAEDLPEARKKWLENRLQAQKESQFQKSFYFKVENIKQLNDLAMVVVSVRDEHNPFFLQTLSMGFGKVEGAWQAAPVSGQFTLSGFGTNSLREITTRNTLEKWASDTESQVFIKLRDELQQQYQQDTARHRLPEMPLVSGSKEDAARYFIQMCRERDVAGLLACLSDDVRDHRNAALISEVFQTPQSRWSVLLNKNYAFCILPELEDEGDLVSVGLFITSSSQEQQIIELEVSASAKGWIVKVTESLDFQEEGGLKNNVFHSYNLVRGNRNRIDEVQSYILTAFTDNEHNNSIDGIGMFHRSIVEKDLQMYLESIAWEYSLVEENKNLTGDEVAKRFIASLELWKSLTKTDAFRVKELERVESEKCSLVQWLVYPRSNPDKISVRPTLFVRSEKGLALAPEFNVADLPEEWLVSAEQRIALEGHEERLLHDVLDNLLTNVVYLDEKKFAVFEESDETRIQTVCESLLDAMRIHGVDEQSRFLTIYRGDQKVVLSVLGSMTKWVKKTSTDYVYSNAIVSGRLAFAVLEIKYKNSVDSEYVGLPLVKLEQGGVRVFPIYQYLYEHGRGQPLMNKKMFKSMQAEKDDAFVREYLILVEKFNNEIKAKLELKK